MDDKALVNDGDDGERREHEVERMGHITGFAPATLKLVEILKRGQPGDLLTDEVLSQACGREVTVGGNGYNNLRTAIRRCIAYEGVRWKRVAGEGVLRCLKANEIVDDMRGDRRHVGRVLKGAVCKSLLVKPEELPAGDRPGFMATRAQLMTLSAWSTTRAEKRLERAHVSKPLDVRKLLVAFTNGKSE